MAAAVSFGPIGVDLNSCNRAGRAIENVPDANGALKRDTNGV